IRKKEAADASMPKPKRFAMASTQERKAIIPFLSAPEQFEYVRANEDIIILKKSDMEGIAVLFAGLYVKKMGIKAGKIIRDELIPAHDLALSTIVTSNLQS